MQVVDEQEEEEHHQHHQGTDILERVNSVVGSGLVVDAGSMTLDGQGNSIRLLPEALIHTASDLNSRGPSPLSNWSYRCLVVFSMDLHSSHILPYQSS